jgi:predicted RNase H-like HicB family nuclease
MKSKRHIVRNLPVGFFKEGNSFVAYSQAVDLTTCGRTLDEAKKNFAEALQILFEECARMGTLGQVLESCGWKKVGKSDWKPPVLVAEDTVEVPSFALA